ERARLTSRGIAAWPLSRPPPLFETSMPGVFAVGDVRSTSVKRVASAVGEGSVCIQLVHKVLAEESSSVVGRDAADAVVVDGGLLLGLDIDRAEVDVPRAVER